ncbi:hypothetical protein Acr_08g0009870 [Actinidia rufa]|uniref:Uncharacterized protein n=1 Tax=Actinidia rufa TaxID=165716 RepID=A0A7J0F1M4_9ERIC|nr:hypothetical protein Acr_08g0009870 [Actinidia rufa]
MPSSDWILYSYVSCPYSSPPVRVSSVAARRGYASWMFRLRIPNLFSTVLSVPNIRGAARLLRPRLVPVGAVGAPFPHSLCYCNKFQREKKIVVAGPSCLWSFLSLTTVVPPLHAGGAPLFDTGMVLNRAQMLIRDSEALAQFRVDHRILDNVVIERLGPNDDGIGWKERMLEGNHYLRLRKPNQPQTRLVMDSPDKDQYLNDFIWISGQWEFPAGEPDPFSIPRHRGYVPVAAIRAVNNYGRSCKVSNLLSYVFLYRYTILFRATCEGRPILPPLQICGLGLRPRSSLSDEVSDLFEGTSVELRRLLEEAKGESSGSNESSSSSWDVDLGDEGLDEEAEVDDDEEVDQVPAVRHPWFQSPCRSSSSGSQGNEEIMAPKVRTLRKGQAPRIEPPMLSEATNSSMPIPAEDQSIAPSSMATDTSKDHETCVALGNAVMLPQDVADHAAETTVEFGGKLVMLGAQGAVDLKKANQKANSLEKELKQTKSELADARSAAEIATLQRNQAQQEASDLKAFACGELAELRPGVFQEGWLACLKELKIPLDHPAWSSPAPPIQFSASPERYSPIILLELQRRSVRTLPTDEENINTTVAMARTEIEGTVDGD